jgi:hypothetical protein
MKKSMHITDKTIQLSKYFNGVGFADGFADGF